MQLMRIAVLASLLATGFVAAEESEAESWLQLPAVDRSGKIASLIDPGMVTTASRTSYGVPYELAYPVCEVNRGSAYWQEGFGIPELGTWLLVRSRDTGLATLCVVIGTFRFEADEARLLNISPYVVDALGVDVKDGLFDIIVEEYFWNADSTAATRSTFLEQPQVFFSRMDRYLSLRGLEDFRDYGMLESAMVDDFADEPVAIATANGPNTFVPPDDLPHFPWPAPPPSVRPVEFPRRFYAEAHTLGLFDALLQEGLQSVGYFDRSYYYVPSGFAVVTRLEQINGDATPKPDPERWPPALQVSRRWSIGAYLRLLFTAQVPVGYGRVLVFVVTDDDCVVASEACGGDQTKVDQETVSVWLNEGLVRLPPSMADIALSDAHAVWGLVYEFEKPVTGDPYQTFDRDHHGQTHLVRAGIWDYFDRR